MGHTPAPPPVNSPRVIHEPVVAALKNDDYSEVIERAVFRKDGSLGVSISRSRTSGHLVVVNAAVGGEARSLGLTVGCAVVEMNGESLGVSLDDAEFAALLAALERPFILGFRRPLAQEQAMKEAEEEAIKRLQEPPPQPKPKPRTSTSPPPKSVLAKPKTESNPVTRFDHTFPAGPLGMNLMVTDRGLEVKSVDANGSASKGGITPGARIIAVEGEPLPDVPQSKLQVYSAHSYQLINISICLHILHFFVGLNHHIKLSTHHQHIKGCLCLSFNGRASTRDHDP
jgi:predicted metalloprotease with PDZ domain